MQIFLFFALVIAALAVVFALQNSASAEVTFLTWRADTSLALVLLISLAAGALISFLFSLPANIKARWTIRQQRKRITDMESQLTQSNAELDQVKSRMALMETKLTLVENRDSLARHVPQPAETGVEPATVEEDGSRLE